ncbi:hypothetical protein CLU95_3549 [Variovorax sp. 54]|uniref:hypothetical protein n=1 Tax=Variovorax sp. 54 TaxID=2035212 RepID=UPI000C1A34AA|nr:hypothetical protein [Variovorax sp. 54]PIF76389.1 hypothetical protein CLU95_3549 [Variovorax sp. 54]
MFIFEAAFQSEKRSRGIRSALKYYADIAEETRLYDPKEGANRREECSRKPTRKERVEQEVFARPSFSSVRAVFDFNEHFIELSNSGGMARSLALMLLVLATTPGIYLIHSLVADAFGILSGTFEATRDRMIGMGIGLGFLIFSLALFYFFWGAIFAPAFFTSLRARYRFNRTTRTVYVLRPKKYGGNAVLEWGRVQAHVNWVPPSAWTPSQIANDPAAREARSLEGRRTRYLLLYWPPMDANDPERKGEDVIWVGDEGAGESLWQYIRTYMEEGMNSVPWPGVDHWLRKGFSGASEHLEETVMHQSHVNDDLAGGGTSTGTYVNYAANLPWAPLNSLAERLCYWPTFPEEWNSDCGQKRRESGIGPEEPMRWPAKF